VRVRKKKRGEPKKQRKTLSTAKKKKKEKKEKKEIAREHPIRRHKFISAETNHEIYTTL